MTDDRRQLTKIDPLPPEPIPVQPPSLDLPPTDYREYIMREKFRAWKSQTLLRSRTITSIVVSILGFILAKLLGLDIDLGEMIEAADGLQLGELILTIGAVLAAYFRKNVRADLSKPKKPSNG